MARDYAARNRRPTSKAASLPGWVWLVAGLSMGLVVACIVYIGRPAEPIPMTPAGAAAKAVTVKPAPKVEIPPVKEPRFDFYTLLENEEVVVGDDGRNPRGVRSATPPPLPTPSADPASGSTATAPAVSPAPRPTVPAPAASGGGDRFLVLAGSFRDLANAEAHKAKLAMSGIEAGIESVKLQDGSVMQRVRIGPRPSQAEAERVLAQLKSHGFDGRVIRAP